MLKDKKILLIISGGIAAYKTLELIRLIRKNNGTVQCILTEGGSQFVTPLSVSSLSGNQVYSDLWSLNDESDMGHIRLSRDNDLIVVAPASADIMAKMAHGMANDLATTTLLAANKPVLLAPGMNPEMWENTATQVNITTLKERGVMFTGPNNGEMACGETGLGRMSEPEEIFTAITDFFFEKPLKGYTALVTSGPTYEPLDPVRFLGNRSSGKQGYAIATALRNAGANVTLITGPTNLPDPQGMTITNIQTANDMLKACTNTLPVNIAICAAAVSDWCVDAPSAQKIKKTDDNNIPKLRLKQTPDILKMISAHPKNRPELVIGFAAETQNLEKNAKAKLKKKGCDWIIANEVGIDENGIEKTFGSDENQIYFITQDQNEKWNRASKDAIAQKLVQQIINYMDKNNGS
ncbi:MAG: bifunctional phosphopantothenoylcysteine decarboxylase/phosphopantothenate--cysteine ligase CoaBC [Alphaproteobacteria bacterium]|nr:MAG: bifunctional phosphopantothenoylcysteine decarboxylase/phosphopantothenate--cysteine ligase CoaBC [Alphaproteobacteria bacterium]